MNCKPGDLAIIVRPQCFIENVGTLVKCENCEEGGLWTVTLMQHALTLKGILQAGETGMIHDNCLRPLPPEFDVSEFDKEKVLEAV